MARRLRLRSPTTTSGRNHLLELQSRSVVEISNRENNQLGKIFWAVIGDLVQILKDEI
jgi:hypothetical protein